MEDILRVVSLLMQFGANVSIENAERDTPVRLVQNGQDAVSIMLALICHVHENQSPGKPHTLVFYTRKVVFRIAKQATNMDTLRT